MDLKKHLDYFNPLAEDLPIHIVGCGAVGSHIATGLVRLGIQSLTLWDFDTVEPHNITNQIYTQNHINRKKTEALKEHCLTINPDIKITIKDKYTTNQLLNGYVFLAVDSIELRKAFIEAHYYHTGIILLIDTRIGLEEAQIFTASFIDQRSVERLKRYTDFTSDEVDAPVNACGTTLSILPSVQTAASFAIANFINYIRTNKYYHTIYVNAFSFKCVAHNDNERS